jgi:hypothetical protein
MNRGPRLKTGAGNQHGEAYPRRAEFFALPVSTMVHALALPPPRTTIRRALETTRGPTLRLFFAFFVLFCGYSMPPNQAVEAGRNLI